MSRPQRRADPAAAEHDRIGTLEDPGGVTLHDAPALPRARGPVRFRRAGAFDPSPGRRLVLGSRQGRLGRRSRSRLIQLHCGAVLPRCQTPKTTPRDCAPHGALHVVGPRGWYVSVVDRAGGGAAGRRDGRAQDLKIGLKTEPSSLDPQYHNLAANNQIAAHIFEPLIAKDDKQLPIPGLAVVVEDDQRHGVGVQASPGREVPGRLAVHRRGRGLHLRARAPRCRTARRPSPLVTRQMTALEIVDPLTLRITTARPRRCCRSIFPALPDPVAHRRRRRRAGRQDDGRAQPRRGAGRHRPVQVRRRGSAAPSSCSRATTAIGGRSPPGRK